jgi:hypothetical protein
VILHSPVPAARRLVTAVASAEPRRLDPHDYEGLVEEFEAKIDLSDLDRALDALIGRLERFDSAIDMESAPIIHQHLRLTRRQAAAPGPWRYLAVIFRPDFIHHRWEVVSPVTMRSRFWTMGTRHDNNSFYRLWWMAEITHEEGSYELTQKLLSRPHLATAVFVRSLSWYQPAVRACVEALYQMPTDAVEMAVRQFNKLLSTTPLEGLSYEDCVELLEGLIGR